MSTRNLNLICKNIIHRTVTEIIEPRKFIEAKNQLTHTNKRISEISFDLGYNEKAGFSIEGKINRKHWGPNWSAALEAGGVLVSDDVKFLETFSS